jgi:hypothetical protein
MTSHRFHRWADLFSSLIYFLIAGYFASQVAKGDVPTFSEFGTAFFSSDISVLLATGGIGVMLLRLPNLASVRFAFGIFVLFLAVLIARDDMFASTPLSLHLGTLDAATVAAFCVLCVWLNIHRWILWNFRHPIRQVQ